MVRFAWHFAVITLSTLFFGVAAILLLIAIPNGNPLIWLARPWARTITAACGVRVRGSGMERIAAAGRPCIFLCNHQSHFDVLALMLTLPGQYRILAKRELFFIPVFGWAIWLAGFIPVDRARRDRAITSIERAAEKVRAGRSILIFGEGTRSEDGTLGPLKKGGFHLALQSGAPIVPIAVSGSRAVLPKGSLTILPGEIRVKIMPPIATAGRSMEDLDGLIAEVRQALEAGMNSASHHRRGGRSRARRAFSARRRRISVHRSPDRGGHAFDPRHHLRAR
jgi:1-acyl-sn-glycerol-3-phosphate acyltransferase